MSEFNFKSQICTDRNQSERLLALGLKKETADMGIYYSELYGVDRVFTNDVFDEQPTFDSDEIPAWSLHRLLELQLNSTDTRFEIRFNQLDLKDAYKFSVEHIEWLIKEGYFNKEYLVNQAEIDEHCKGVLEYLDYIREEE